MVESQQHKSELSSCRRRLFDHQSTTNGSANPEHEGSESTQYAAETSTSRESFRKKYSRRQQQRRSRKKAKTQHSTIEKQIEWEEQQLKTTFNNTINTAKQRIYHEFGFVPIPTLTVHKNSRYILGQSHPRTYFPLVQKLAFHDLTSAHKLPPSANQLLGLGLKFIPTPPVNITKIELERSTERFERDIGLKVYFAGDETSDYDSTALRSKSKWRAPLPPLEVDNRIQRFTKRIEHLFIPRHPKLNLSRLQIKTLKQIKNDSDITILSADKGLGPVGIDTKQYIEWGLKHLLDTNTYSILQQSQATAELEHLYRIIHQWTCKHRSILGNDTTQYIREQVEKARKDPWGYFYLLVKLHKIPVSTRPVCSDCASLPHSVGKWVDKQLQPIVRKQRTYFQDSFELKHLLGHLDTLPPNACLFTYDAVSMYTNIDTEECLLRLQTFLEDPITLKRYPHLHPQALIEALHIVMHNNRMKFGDLLVHQHKGIAMGMAPAPSIANLFVAIYEEAHIPTFPSSSLHFIRRFIDDGFGIWLRHADPHTDDIQWNLFQDLINNMGLTWEFSKRSSDITFMDLNIHLRRGRIFTSLYSKPMALHLYIPPSSCHAPGITTGLIHGHFFRLLHLCSYEHDIEREIHLFFTRLMERGYSLYELAPLFHTAEIKVQQRKAQSVTPAINRTQLKSPRNAQSMTDTVFFHLQYHPSNPPPREIQQTWQQQILMPPMKPLLHQLKNRDGCHISLRRLVIAYSRAPNLGNLLSCRKLKVNIQDYTDILHHSPTVPNSEDEET